MRSAFRSGVDVSEVAMRMWVLRLTCLMAVLAAARCGAAEPRRLNPRLLQIEPNQWVKLHEQQPGDAVVFRRQAHGGSCFDTKRGRETYGVNADGVPVAGPRGERPWTMHAFGGVLYDPARDEMVVVSHPGHMVPGRFTDAVRELWPRIERHPTWVYDCKTNVMGKACAEGDAPGVVYSARQGLFYALHGGGYTPQGLTAFRYVPRRPERSETP
jgi:hypothetical protein